MPTHDDSVTGRMAVTPEMTRRGDTSRESKYSSKRRHQDDGTRSGRT
jgi:hypothetical protein